MSSNPQFSGALADRIAYSREAQSPVMGEYLPEYVVLPRSVEEVQQVLRDAAAHDIPVYPYSRGTNFCGFTLPLKGGILLDLHHMNRILEINQETMTATVEPGVTWGQLRKAAADKGLAPMPILGPHTGGVIGNFTSWNYTPYASRYGPDRVTTLEVVLGNGEIMRTGSQALCGHESSNPYFRHAFGPDLTGLFRGSLGWLGIVTKAVVALYPVPEVEKNITFSFRGLAEALSSMQRIERLDITKHIAIYNRLWAAEMCDPEFKRIRDPEAEQAALARYPNWILNVGICGKARQVAFYEELIAEEIADGERFCFEGQQKRYWEDYAHGGGERVTGMFGAAGSAISTLTVTPFSKCIRVYEKARECIASHNFRDPVHGGLYEPSVMYFPSERGRVVYSEFEYRFDPGRPETVPPAMEVWQELMEYYIEELGSSLMVLNVLVETRLMPSYVDMLKGIKKLCDPRGIFSPDRFFRDATPGPK
jgi:glycolate oxidase